MAPRLVNILQQSVGGKLARHVLGISPEKSLPALSDKPFRTWVQEHADKHDAHFSWFGKTDNPVVVLWADSVNAHYRSQLLQSAVSVLGKSGFQVAVARDQFCCGRPLYEYGFLDQARKQLMHIMDHFEPHLPAEAAIVVLEPSCLSVFKDELLQLFPNHPQARKLSERCMTVTALLSQHGCTPQRRLPAGILHRHCHDKAAGTLDEQHWMQQCFESLSEPDKGCCGMAGSFGAKKTTRHLGQTLFNKQLKPAIDTMPPGTVLVSNGFSCSEQITDYTGIANVLHPIEVLDRCL